MTSRPHFPTPAMMRAAGKRRRRASNNGVVTSRSPMALLRRMNIDAGDSAAARGGESRRAAMPSGRSTRLPFHPTRGKWRPVPHLATGGARECRLLIAMVALGEYLPPMLMHSA